jgi:outer membrane receptor protein involved in Fe transport
LFRRPRHSGFAEVSWTGARAALGLAGRFVGRRVDSDFSSLQPAITINEASYVWDARASYRLTGHLTGTAAVDNLTNAQYFEPLGFPALGRVARAGVRVSF